MKSLFAFANKYIKQCDWKDLALIKCCLCAMGVLIGLSIQPQRKKQAAGIFSVVFLATYLPVMAKFCKAASQEKNRLHSAK